MIRILIFCVFVLIFAGCATKPQTSEPHIIYQEKYVPVKCNAKIPVKPKNDGTFEMDKQIAIYYRDCEKKLKQCLGIKEEDGK
ncbi:hypothetical protein [Campylobacter concisus]|uniref:hypothetical protein n=1 Tax=Campylobacter concisus TaxID=199 RepID=UPI000CD982C3|nr:hypothetical protein [Campylobacter concisus]